MLKNIQAPTIPGTELYFVPTSPLKPSHDTDHRTGQRIEHKTGKQHNRWINRSKNKNEQNDQHSYKGHFIMEVDIFKAVIRNITDHH